MTPDLFLIYGVLRFELSLAFLFRLLFLDSIFYYYFIIIFKNFYFKGEVKVMKTQ